MEIIEHGVALRVIETQADEIFSGDDHFAGDGIFLLRLKNSAKQKAKSPAKNEQRFGIHFPSHGSAPFRILEKIKNFSFEATDFLKSDLREAVLQSMANLAAQARLQKSSTCF
jgi:hypothetical protein